jgi:hypothetical protein
VNAFRQRDHDLFGGELLSHCSNVVAVCNVNDMPTIGVNSNAPGSLYNSRDEADGIGIGRLLDKSDPT